MERGEGRRGRGEGGFVRSDGGFVRGEGGSARSAWPARSSRSAAARSSGARLASRATRPVAQRRPVSGTAPAAAAVRRPGPSPAPQPLRRFPNPRLTGLGSGLFCMAVMVLLGYLDALLFGASLTVYSVLFLPVCVLTAVWVRRGDLVSAPVVLPIAFAVGLVPVADNGGGISGHLMGIFTALATQAGWLYGGTLIAGAIVTVRKVRLIARRAAARRRSP
ncbi:DUF6542 domain-containing protein [Streptomyces sp. cf386]|uniref:DUF6542 domain-containing protein n=1 Tax=Streptomyces sp. cf386 TaxID=1761904 RepID=UPI000AE4BC65|nr:DUF6542 domain-containing protein [Streptomyces sp. cf386]